MCLVWSLAILSPSLWDRQACRRKAKATISQPYRVRILLGHGEALVDLFVRRHPQYALVHDEAWTRLTKASISDGAIVRNVVSHRRVYHTVLTPTVGNRHSSQTFLMDAAKSGLAWYVSHGNGILAGRCSPVDKNSPFQGSRPHVATSSPCNPSQQPICTWACACHWTMADRQDTP